MRWGRGNRDRGWGMGRWCGGWKRDMKTGRKEEEEREYGKSMRVG